MKYDFDAKKELSGVLKRLADFKNANRVKGAVLGLSGGKDSATVAMLCKKTFGGEVLALLMPNGEQRDIGDSLAIAKILKLEYRVANIGEAYAAFVKLNYPPAALLNVPPRLRMTALYAAAAERGYLVAGTGNLSEGYVGYCTKHGDAACDFNPLGNFTRGEVVRIGLSLASEFALPEKYILKTPADGLTDKSDEQNFGFSYDALDKYIRTGECADLKTKAKIDKMHAASAHKRVLPIIL